MDDWSDEKRRDKEWVSLEMESKLRRFGHVELGLKVSALGIV